MATAKLGPEEATSIFSFSTVAKYIKENKN